MVAKKIKDISRVSLQEDVLLTINFYDETSWVINGESDIDREYGGSIVELFDKLTRSRTDTSHYKWIEYRSSDEKASIQFMGENYKVLKVEELK